MHSRETVALTVSAATVATTQAEGAAGRVAVAVALTQHIGGLVVEGVIVVAAVVLLGGLHRSGATEGRQLSVDVGSVEGSMMLGAVVLLGVGQCG